MRILLIAPNHRRIVIPSYMKAIQEGVGNLPPLGLMSLAGYIRKHSDYHIRIIDALLEDLTPEGLRAIMEEEKPDVVGIHAITLALLDVLDTSRIVRMSNPGVKIVMGGPHTSIFPEESLGYSEFDYVVLGEGEKPFFDLLKYLETGDKSLLPIDGVMGGEEELNRLASPYIHDDLDTLPPPARDLTQYDRYSTVVSRHPPTTTIMGSRGCPYKCTFCYTAGGKRFRPRSVDNIIKEIQECIELGIREFFFFDETFFIDKDRVIEFCRRIIDEDLHFYWDVRGRVDLVNPEMLRWMKKAGCQRIQYGVESGNARVLKILKKGFTPDMAGKAIGWTREAGISTYADFMIGNPGETMEEIMETIEFARKISPDYVHYSITTPYPKTELYRQALERGIIEKDYWSEFAKNPTEDFRIRYWEENFSAEQLEKLIDKAYRSFYLRPGYLLKSLKKLGSLGELKRKAKAGLSLLKIRHAKEDDGRE